MVIDFEISMLPSCETRIVKTENPQCNFLQFCLHCEYTVFIFFKCCLLTDLNLHFIQKMVLLRTERDVRSMIQVLISI